MYRADRAVLVNASFAQRMLLAILNMLMKSDTLRFEDLGWAKTLDLWNMDGVFDTQFYVASRFPVLHDVDLRGMFVFKLRSQI